MCPDTMGEWRKCAGSLCRDLLKAVFSTNFYALNAFNEKFGTWYPKIHQYQVSASWQSALSLSGTLGNWVGYFYGAWIVDKVGYRKALMINYIVIIPLIGEQRSRNWKDPLTDLRSNSGLRSKSLDAASSWYCTRYSQHSIQVSQR